MELLQCTHQNMYKYIFVFLLNINSVFLLCIAVIFCLPPNWVVLYSWVKSVRWKLFLRLAVIERLRCVTSFVQFRPLIAQWNSTQPQRLCVKQSTFATDFPILYYFFFFIILFNINLSTLRFSLEHLLLFNWWCLILHVYWLQYYSYAHHCCNQKYTIQLSREKKTQQSD